MENILRGLRSIGVIFPAPVYVPQNTQENAWQQVSSDFIHAGYNIQQALDESSPITAANKTDR